jgi:AP-3 complex subunit beta
MSRSGFMEGDDKEGGVMARARNFMSGDAQFFNAQPNFEQIRRQLDNENISSKKEAMKRVVAQICLGNNMAALFPDVVKNIHAASIELRKLIYYFIVHYSEERPNEALLSISAFQHDLVDQSMHVRALALRTLASVRIAAINPVVMVAIKKCSTDLSPLVRRTAATAISKASRIAKGEDNIAQSIPIIAQLLGDRSMEVVGAAAATFLQICPDRFDLVHKHYRRTCRGLLEADEWGQINLLSLLTRYARHQFVDPNKTPQKKKKEKKKAKPDDSDASSDDESSDSDESVDVLGRTLDMDSDHRLLLTSVKPLFTSLNRAVVIGAASLYFHVAPVSDLDVCAKPLVRILNDDASGHYVALIAIQAFANIKTKPFVPYIRDFYLAPNDAPATRRLRMKILAQLVTKENQIHVINEVRSYLRSYDIPKVVDAIRCLGQITYTLPETTATVIKHILPLLSHRNEDAVTEAVVVLRQLVVQSADKTQTTQIVQKLSQRVLKGTVTSANAKASIIWLVGENIRTHANIAKMAPDFFRLFVKSFKTEQSTVKSHVISLGLKIWLNLEGEGPLADRFKAIFFHLLELVKYDRDYDIRDQGRLVETALDRSSACFDALKTAALAPKPLPQQVDTARHGILIGSMSHVLGTVVQGYREITEWPEAMPDPNAREPPEAASSSTVSEVSSDEEPEDESTDGGSESSDSDGASAKKKPAPKSAAAAKKGAGKAAKSSSDDDTDSSSDEDAGPRARPAAATGAKAPARAPVKVKIMQKMAAKPAPKADRVVEELFTKKHVDPTGDEFTKATAMHGVQLSYRAVRAGDHVDLTVKFENTGGTDFEEVKLDEEAAADRIESHTADGFALNNGETHQVKVTVRDGYPQITLNFTLDVVETIQLTADLPQA